MVISFMVEKARKHLEDYGFVYTLRPKKRKRTGKDWYNHFRTDTKKGTVFITYMGIGKGEFLEYIWNLSGFNSLEEWLNAANGSKYLYRVELLEEKEKWCAYLGT